MENPDDPEFEFEDFVIDVKNTSFSSAFHDELMDSDDENRLIHNVSESEEPEQSTQLVDTCAGVVHPSPSGQGAINHPTATTSTLTRSSVPRLATNPVLTPQHQARPVLSPPPPSPTSVATPSLWRNVSVNDPGPAHTIPIYRAEKGAKLPISFDAGTEPIEYFALFFNDAILQHICNETNLFANKRKTEVQSQHSRLKKWNDINLVTMKAFLGSVINKGLIPLPSIESYYTTSWEGRIPFFSNVFTKDEFLNIFWNLHFNHRSNQNPVRKGFLIEPILKHMKNMCKKYYTTGSRVAIDECTISFKGHLSFHINNPNKPTKFGLKVFLVSDSTNGYIFDFVPHFGKGNLIPNSKLLKTTQIVKVLSESVVMKDPLAPARGLHVYTDTYYTSPELAGELLKIGCHLTGTVMTNRSGMPPGLKAKGKKMKTGDIYSQRKGSTLVLSWKDKRAVHMLSTFSKGSMKHITNVPSKWPNKPPNAKPHVILDYIKHTAGIDRSDHFMSSYQFMQRTKKWYRKIFFWLLEVGIVDAYLLYKMTQESQEKKPLSLNAFRQSLVRSLVQEKVANRPTAKQRGRPVQASLKSY